jgi:hypothetical protein
VATLRAAGIRVNIILTESGFAKPGSSSQQTEIFAKADGTESDPEAEYTPVSTEDLATYIPDPAFTGSTDAYGAIADGTGGVFLGIAKGDTDRMVAAVENLTAGGIFPAIVQVLPKDAPAGATLDVIIQGQNTNFDDSVTVAVGGGITVNDLTRNSPIELVANVSIPDDAAAGLVDVTATSAIEEASGVNVFEITPPTEAATVLSVTPFTAVVGETLDVVIHGLNTEWTDDSAVSFGDAGVTVNSVSATSATTLMVNITVGEDASIAFLDVAVDGAIRRTAFRVASTAAQATATITAIDPDTISPGASLEFTITGAATNFDDTSEVSFSGSGLSVTSITVNSTTELVATVEAAEDADPGFRDVFVTTGAATATGLQLLQVLEGPDTDGDGVLDRDEECDEDPDKTEPGVCGCGVADLDTDADGVLDCNDNCPADENPDQADADGDDIGDVCDAPAGGGSGGSVAGGGCGGGGMCGAGMIWVLPVLLLTLGRIRTASGPKRRG